MILAAVSISAVWSSVSISLFRYRRIYPASMKIIKVISSPNATEQRLANDPLKINHTPKDLPWTRQRSIVSSSLHCSPSKEAAKRVYYVSFRRLATRVWFVFYLDRFIVLICLFYNECANPRRVCFCFVLHVPSCFCVPCGFVDLSIESNNTNSIRE